jgi:dTDP-4-dehydrorhamnose 3,5-epimerase
MRLVGTPLSGLWIITPAIHRDERGTFSTHFAQDWFHKHGLQSAVAQVCTSVNPRAGTLRGMHWQDDPHGEVKLVRCLRGAIYDVVLDLRPDSPTFRQWHAVELTEENGQSLYVPTGCAHGYQTMVADSCVAYQISVSYVPASARGVRWNDPAFGIVWPACESRIVSERDSSFADFRT